MATRGFGESVSVAGLMHSVQADELGEGLGIPEVFCWTKYGAESGEPALSIIERKELERRLNGGLFLWGVGNSIRPSLQRLLGQAALREILFSPMVSQPRKRDSQPSALVVWRRALGFDGNDYRIPAHSLVISRAPSSMAGARHFALVCSSSTCLTSGKSSSTFGALEVRNLITGSSLGSSQVTAVVRFQHRARKGRIYQAAFRAVLVYPYFLELRDPVRVPENLRLDRGHRIDKDARRRALLRLRRAEDLTRSQAAS